jgi:hypothetical protein
MEFTNKSNKYDIYHPTPGHEKRFAQKLEKAFSKRKVRNPKFILWKVAALLIMLGVGGEVLFNMYEFPIEDPIIKERTEYFSLMINNEIQSLKQQTDPQTEILINNTLNELKKLENDYKKIIIDYKRNNENKSLLNAMINNFRKRIELIEFTKFQLNKIQQLKNKNHVQKQV